MFSESRAELSLLAAVTPIAAMTASTPENAAVRPARSASEETTTTRDLAGTPVMRSGRERTIAVNAMFSPRHTLRTPWPRPPAAPITATLRGSGRGKLTEEFMPIPPDDWLTRLNVHLPRRVLQRRGVTYGITLTNERAPMADQPEVLLCRFWLLQKAMKLRG